jgi:hypothetical protein
VSAAEVLSGARIDDSDLDHAVVTLLPAHAEAMARVNTHGRWRSMEAGMGSSDRNRSLITKTSGRELRA